MDSEQTWTTTAIGSIVTAIAVAGASMVRAANLGREMDLLRIRIEGLEKRASETDTQYGRLDERLKNLTENVIGIGRKLDEVLSRLPLK